MTAPDLTTYRAVHTALRDGAHRLAAASASLDAADRRRVKAFAAYWKGYAGEVLAHHTVEDEFVFPALEAATPVAASYFERTAGDHHHLDELMADITAAVDRLRAGTNDPALPRLLGELDAHMDEHLGFEDDDILPLIERHIDAADYVVLEEQAMKAVGLGRQAAFTIPFVAAAVDEATRRLIFDGAPAAFRVLYRLTRGRYARLEALAFGPAAAPARAVA